MEKTKSKAGKHLKLDRFEQRVRHAARFIDKRRRERAERAAERRLLRQASYPS